MKKAVEALFSMDSRVSSGTQFVDKFCQTLPMISFAKGRVEWIKLKKRGSGEDKTVFWVVELIRKLFM